jgi:ketosteroid isomerase-like protein
MDGESAALAAVEVLNAAVNRHDAAAVAAAMTDDCVFESTAPPDGVRFVGRADVEAFFRGLFDSAGERSFESEETFAAGDRVVVLWRHRWVDGEGRPGSIRGVDVFRVRDGKVAEKLSYVKG